MESWTEIKIAVNAKDIDRAGDIANVVVPYGIYIEDYTALEQEVQEIAHIDLIDEDLLKKDRSVAYVHIYLEPDVSPNEAVAFLSERYNAEGIEHKIELLDCAEEDWRNNWKKYFNPIAVGEKLLIRPSWRDDYDPQGRIVLNIDPGLAFGTGSHETTRLCLEMCEKYMKKGDCLVMNDSRVLPARLIGSRLSGGLVELVLLRDLGDGCWECLSRPGRKTKPGTELTFGDGELTATVMDVAEGGNRIVKFHFEGIFI